MAARTAPSTIPRGDFFLRLTALGVRRGEARRTLSPPCAKCIFILIWHEFFKKHSSPTSAAAPAAVLSSELERASETRVASRST